MAEPTLKEPDDADETVDTESGDTTPTPEAEGTASDDDYEMAFADQGDAEDPDGFFDGVDADPETSGSTDAGDFFDGQDSGSDGDDDGDGVGLFDSDDTGPIAPRVNETVGQLGVFGLEDGDEKDQLESDFHELAETVQFGRFTEKSIEKHLNANWDDIDPVWGMMGAALIIAAAVVYKRPDIDADQITDSLSGSLGSVNLPFLNDDDE